MNTMKQKIKVTTAKLFDHLHKVKKRHVERFIHTRTHTHHTMIHMGELVVVGMIGFSSLLFANYNNSYEHLHRDSSQEIVQSLTKAIGQEKPKTNESKIISVWEMDGNVDNTFAAWYCTYWAARISPEFFPYSEDKMTQERTRWGNAIDRCENAEKAGFKIGSTASVGSLIVYKKVGSNVTFWHVGKIMYYNKNYQSLIVRDMNRIGKFIMSDRWENAENENIKCFIYPKKTSDQTENTNNTITGWNNTTPIVVTTGWTIIANNSWSNTPSNNNSSTVQSWTTSEPNSQNNHNAATDETPVIEEQINTNQEPENNDLYNQLAINNEIVITPNDSFSDISKHFFSQYEMKITIIKEDKLTVWENVLLKITIINKETKEPYQGILPFVFNSISQNTILEWSLETLQLIHNQENTITFKAKEKGSSTILLTIDDQKIATILLTIQ